LRPQVLLIRFSPQSIAAATTDLWPSLANTLVVPWRGTQIAKPQYTPSTRARATSEHDRDLPASKHRSSVIPNRTELPGFLHDAIPARLLPSDVANMNPTNIRSELSNMSRQSLVMANPFIRRSPQVLLSRSIGVAPGLRVLHTYRPSPLQSLTWPAQLRPQQQYRGFGTGGISRSLLANREAAANRNPNSATAQNAFYQILLKANMPAIVVERYQSGM
jgi:ATP-dependent metalloprotease